MGPRGRDGAAAAFVAYGFEKLSLPRIAATVEKGHRASERILSKLGFVLEHEEAAGANGRVISHYELVRPSQEEQRRAGSVTPR